MMNGAFKRNYEGDYHCTEEDVKAMIRDANDSGNDGILIEIIQMILIVLPLVPIATDLELLTPTISGMIMMIRIFHSI